MKSALLELAKKIAGMDELGQHYYKNQDGCLCAVGVIMKECGVLDSIIDTNLDYNVYRVSLLTRKESLQKEFKVIRDTYGLNDADLMALQYVNDHEHDPEKRKLKVAKFLIEKSEKIDKN